MIRHEYLSSRVGLFRFYAAPTRDPFALYVAVCSVVYEKDCAAWLKGMCGSARLHHLIDMARFFDAAGITTVFAERVGDKRLPLFDHCDDHQISLIDNWIARFGQASA